MMRRLTLLLIACLRWLRAAGGCGREPPALTATRAATSVIWSPARAPTSALRRIDLNTGETHQRQGQHAVSDGQHGQDRGRRRLSGSGRPWPPLARRFDRQGLGAQPDGADADPFSDNRATDMLINDLGGPAAIQTGSISTMSRGMRVDRNIAQLLKPTRATCGTGAIRSTPLAMVELLRRLDRGNDPVAVEPHYLLDLMAPVPDRQEPDAGAAAGRNPGRAQDRHAQRLCQRRRLHHRCPTAGGSRSRSSPAAAPTARAPSPRPRARSTTASARS